MADSSTDILIIGAGIAGLAAGCFAQMNGGARRKPSGDRRSVVQQ